MGRRLRVGIMGLQPGRSWAARAHLPALRSMPDLFEVAGVANTSLESARRAADACDIPHAFASVEEMAQSDEIDVLSVTVKVPHHFALVEAAVKGGKHIYCEWPLGNGLAEGEAMARMVAERGLVGVSGNQARTAPAIQFVRKLIADGYVGDVLSVSLLGRGRSWGAFLDHEGTRAYLLDRANGATMMTIPMGHTLAALRDCLGDVIELQSAMIDNRRHEVPALDTGNILKMTAPDQVLVTGRLAGGAPLSIHYRGGMPRGIPGLVWEILGTHGDLRITGDNGNAQMVDLTVEGARGEDQQLRPLEIPTEFRGDFPEEVIPGNVARVYRRMAYDIAHGTQTAPSFADAVELHRVLDAMEKLAASSRPVSVEAPNRLVPLVTELDPAAA